MITYIATNTTNGKFYIGSTVDFERRKTEHLASNSKYPFQQSLRKNPENFVWVTAKDNLDHPLFEQKLLDLYYGTELCYNLNPKADRPPSQAGREVSKETRQRQSRARIGLKRTKETKTKQSLSKKGAKNPMFNVKGQDHPSSKRTGEKNPSSKKVRVIYPDGVVRVFSSTVLAGCELGCHAATVAIHARNNRFPSKGNLAKYHFSYL